MTKVIDYCEPCSCTQPMQVDCPKKEKTMTKHFTLKLYPDEFDERDDYAKKLAGIESLPELREECLRLWEDRESYLDQLARSRVADTRLAAANVTIANLRLKLEHIAALCK